MSSSQKKLLSLVIPVFNEEANIRRVFEAVMNVLAGSPYALEVIFVNDGSSDRSAERIEALAKENSQVISIELSRNFGKEVALTAGITEAKGDAVIMLDADLQHPPARIPDFISEWERGAEVVIGVRAISERESLFRRTGSRMFTFLMNTISDMPAVLHETDFRLIDRKVAEEFRRFGEHRRITRGIIDWLGFRRAFVGFSAPVRAAGGRRYSYKKLFGLAFSAIIAHSFFPLRITGYLGLLVTAFAGLLGTFIIIEQPLLGDPLNLEVSGTAMVAVMILFLVGIILTALGLLALYIESIKNEVTARPLYAVRKRTDSQNA